MDGVVCVHYLKTILIPPTGGSYIYIETFGGELSYTATLVSSKFTGTESDHRQCLTFYYYISRGDDFDLGVQFVAENTTVAEPVWSLPGKILNRWNIAEFELGVAGWFFIEARLAGYSRGPISIDDIQFTDCLLDGMYVGGLKRSRLAIP